ERAGKARHSDRQGLGDRRLRLLRALGALAILAAVIVSGAPAAHAIDAVNIRGGAPAIDLTDAVERQTTDSGRIQGSTAPGADGIVRRIEVRAREGGNYWAVVALANNGDEQLERLFVVPHYRLVNSGLVWPDL